MRDGLPGKFGRRIEATSETQLAATVHWYGMRVRPRHARLFDTADTGTHGEQGNSLSRNALDFLLLPFSSCDRGAEVPMSDAHWVLCYLAEAIIPADGPQPH